jgi:hypothetical protein
MTGTNTNLFEAFSYANSNVSYEVCKLQRLVFQKLNLPITQVNIDSNHGDFLTQTAKNCNSKYIIFFDVDCIPLVSNIYDIILDELKNDDCIIGIEQMCNCNPLNHLYAGPACLAFPTALFKNLGYPSLMQQGNRSDVGEELTWLCEENNINVKLFKAKSSEIPKWKLKDNRYFGIGTTYNHNNMDVLYHQFEIRNSSTNFIAKCKSILN